MTEVNGKTPWILVTGGSRGIGRGLVLALTKAGFEVAFTYKNSSESAAELEREVREAGGDAVGFLCDVTSDSDVQQLAQRLLGQRGAPFGIVNNAGITRDSLMMRMSSLAWSEVIDTNLNAAFYVTRAFIQAMTERGAGVVLQMSSVAGHKGVVGQTNYSATKAGVSAMTRALALELARFNIRVNAIAPGFIATDMISAMPEAQRRTIKSSIPLRRIGSVEDVAGLAVFLMSEQASYITGQIFTVDGGLTV